MTMLYETETFLVEVEAGTVKIARYADGKAKLISRRGFTASFCRAVKAQGVDAAARLALREVQHEEWLPMYRPDRMPRKQKKATA